jgi:hypothetical protein
MLFILHRITSVKKVNLFALVFTHFQLKQKLLKLKQKMLTLTWLLAIGSIHDMQIHVPTGLHVLQLYLVLVNGCLMKQSADVKITLLVLIHLLQLVTKTVTTLRIVMIKVVAQVEQTVVINSLLVSN